MTTRTLSCTQGTNFFPAHIAFMQAFCADMTRAAFTRTGMTGTDHFPGDFTFRDMMHTEGFMTDVTAKRTVRTGLLSAECTGLEQ